MTQALPQAARVAPRLWLGPLLLALGAVGIGFAPIGLRLGLDTLGPQAIAFWRYVFALPLLFVLLVSVERRLPRAPNRAILAAGVFFTLDIALWHWALERTSVANATFLVNLGSILVGLLAWAVLRERPGITWPFAAAIACAGAAFLSFGAGAEAVSSLDGDVLALGAALLVSGYLLFSRLARRSLGALDVIFWLTVVEAVTALLVTLGSGERLVPRTGDGFLAPLFLAMVVQVGGQGLIIAGLGRTPAAVAGVLMMIQPVTAALVAWLLLSEPLSGYQGVGAMLIVGGVLLAQKGLARPRPATASKPS